MGAITFSIDLDLLAVLKTNLPIHTFVETGTFKGETINKVKSFFSEIYSIELSDVYYQNAIDAFKELTHIHILHGDSADRLRDLSKTLSHTPVIYWLDAHWCVDENTAGKLSQCSLLGELSAIHQLQSESVIIIDDARLFLATPPAPHETSHWPSFQEIIHSLSKISTSHQIMVVNDTILFFPIKIKNSIETFASTYNYNLLTMADKSRDYDTLLTQLHEKDKEIRMLKTVCDEREALLLQNNQHQHAKKTLFAAITRKTRAVFLNLFKKSLI